MQRLKDMLTYLGIPYKKEGRNAISFDMATYEGSKTRLYLGLHPELNRHIHDYTRFKWDIIFPKHSPNFYKVAELPQKKTLHEVATAFAEKRHLAVKSIR
jgi:hypothetical protein